VVRGQQNDDYAYGKWGGFTAAAPPSRGSAGRKAGCRPRLPAPRGLAKITRISAALPLAPAWATSRISPAPGGGLRPTEAASLEISFPDQLGSQILVQEHLPDARAMSKTFSGLPAWRRPPTTSGSELTLEGDHGSSTCQGLEGGRPKPRRAKKDKRGSRSRNTRRSRPHEARKPDHLFDARLDDRLRTEGYLEISSPMMISRSPCTPVVLQVAAQHRECLDQPRNVLLGRPPGVQDEGVGDLVSARGCVRCRRRRARLAAPIAQEPRVGSVVEFCRIRCAGMPSRLSSRDGCQGDRNHASARSRPRRN